MLNFELYNPVKLVFGKGEIEKVSTLIPKESKILVAYGGGSIFKNGIYDQVKKALEGFNVVEFGGIEANPYFETLMKAVEIIREQKIDHFSCWWWKCYRRRKIHFGCCQI